MMHFGGTLTLNGLVAYVAYNAEKVMIGRFWGADAIGIYGRAYQLVNIPTDNLNSAVGERGVFGAIPTPGRSHSSQELLPQRLLSGPGTDPAHYDCLCSLCGVM